MSLDTFTTFCVCPNCRGDLLEFNGQLQCHRCLRLYEVSEGVPILLPEYAETDRELRTSYLENYNQIAQDDLVTPIVMNRDNLLHATLLDFIGDVSGKAVLDIGSANGLYLRKLNARLKMAVDLAHPYLKTIQGQTSIIPICGDAEYIPIKLKLFDVIVISDVLEHLLHPEALVSFLYQECHADTRIIIHIPWEESLEPYKNSPYKFVHLRSFTTYTFRLLFYNFDVKKQKSALALMAEPLIFQLESYLPNFLFNLLIRLYFTTELNILEYNYRAKWIYELPRRDWWLLKFYKPQVKMFELRKRRPVKLIAPLKKILAGILAAWNNKVKPKPAVQPKIDAL